MARTLASPRSLAFVIIALLFSVACRNPPDDGAELEPEDLAERPAQRRADPKLEDVATAVYLTETRHEAPKAEEPNPPAPLERPATAPGSPLRVARLVVTATIEAREPTNQANLSIERPVVAFVEIENPSSTVEDIVVTFEQTEGPKLGKVRLPIPAARKRWRTWAETEHIKTAGEWFAVVRTANGTELARTSFTVGA